MAVSGNQVASLTSSEGDIPQVARGEVAGHDLPLDKAMWQC